LRGKLHIFLAPADEVANQSDVGNVIPLPHARFPPGRCLDRRYLDVFEQGGCQKRILLKNSHRSSEKYKKIADFSDIQDSKQSAATKEGKRGGGSALRSTP
jgi:hypothetical protein